MFFFQILTTCLLKLSTVSNFAREIFVSTILENFGKRNENFVNVTPVAQLLIHYLKFFSGFSNSLGKKICKLLFTNCVKLSVN